ncbi:MAG: response regulator [Parcubacteria group bacterium]|nr:response regulator [Parcubacteria group bacterium]
MEQHKILIAEDDALLLRSLKDRFEKEGFIVFPAHNGFEALKMALENHPEIVLLDIVMPVMDGMTALKKLREDEWGKTASVIILTNLSDSSKVAEAVAVGVYDFLIKIDWKLDDLVKKVWGQIKQP